MKDIELINYPSMIVLGLDFYGDPFSNSSWWSEENEIGLLWKRFMKNFKVFEYQFQGFLKNRLFHEIHILNEEYKETGQYEIFIGMEIQDIPKDSLNYLIKTLQPQEYVKITLCGEEIYSDYYAELEIICNTKFRKTILKDYLIQTYDERYKGINNVNASEMDVLIPVRAL